MTLAAVFGSFWRVADPAPSTRQIFEQGMARADPLSFWPGPLWGRGGIFGAPPRGVGLRFVPRMRAPRQPGTGVQLQNLGLTGSGSGDKFRQWPALANGAARARESHSVSPLRVQVTSGKI